MILIAYGTRPEIIKFFPLIKAFEENNIQFATLFTGQHPDLYKNMKDLIPKPNYCLHNIMETNQSLNKLSSKILNQIDDIFQDVIHNHKKLDYVMVQGDTTTSVMVAMATFYRNIKVIHLEAGLRTHNKQSPYPEEVNRQLISRIAEIHLCPTELAVINLKNENITENVYNVGNTIVDAYEYIVNSQKIKKKLEKVVSVVKNRKYILITLHRRENRGNKMIRMWKQINELADCYPLYHFLYITHPSLKDVSSYLTNKNIILQEPCDYITMVLFIKNCVGIITDSGGIQEEAISADKRILVCRNTTERPETIENGYGLLIDDKIKENISFLLDEKIDNTNSYLLNNTNSYLLNNSILDNSLFNYPVINPYGENVCEKIIGIVKNL
jgi:UDP-N-acetylglucosamine 2-epimerase (non-hydrolysing)